MSGQSRGIHERSSIIDNAPNQECSREQPRAWTGCLLWLTVCVLAVALRGVRWDETYEHAQVLLGRVTYPEGHPLYRYVHNAFSLQTYVSAGLLWLGVGEAALCGFRNVLCLASAVIPVFLFATLLSGRPLWGHVAAAFALRGVFLSFGGSYPLVVWPGTYSNGPVGGACALLALYWLLAGRLRPGGLLTGLMPALHIGQAPPILIQYAVDAWVRLRRHGLRPALRQSLWMALGLVACAVVIALALISRPPVPTDGGYAPATPAQPIWKYYTEIYDGHRQPPPANGHLALGGLLWVSGCALLACRKRSASESAATAWHGVLLYALILATLVWGTFLIHAKLGPDMPFLLIGWMPYRLINHAAPLLLAAVVACAASQSAKPSVAIALLLLLGYASLSGEQLAALTSPGFAQRYLAGGELVVFFLFGVAVAGLLSAAPRWTFFVSAVLFAVLACVHRSGAAWCAFGVVVSVVASPRSDTNRKLELGAGLLATFVVCVLLWQQAVIPRAPRTGPFERRVTEILRELGEPQAMLLAGPNEPLLQARTGHPVLVEATTASLMGYMPTLAPTIRQMYDDIYGLRFDAPPPSVAWQTRWADRTPTEWAVLGARYGVRYVVTPDALSLKVPALFSDGGMTLHEIPR